VVPRFSRTFISTSWATEMSGVLIESVRKARSAGVADC